MAMLEIQAMQSDSKTYLYPPPCYNGLANTVHVPPMSSKFWLPAPGCLCLKVEATLLALEPTLSPQGRSEEMKVDVSPTALHLWL